MSNKRQTIYIAITIAILLFATSVFAGPESPNITDHGRLTGLADDDHSGYPWLAGRAGGQTLKGGTTASETLTLMSTSHATKGKILFGTSAYDEVNNRLGIGTAAPAYGLDIQGTSARIADGYSWYWGAGNARILGNASTNTLSLYSNGSANLVLNAGNVGIGETAPARKLDILGGAYATGVLRIADVSTESTTKLSQIVTRNYTNAEEDVMLFTTSAGSANNIVNIGGGNANYNAATIVAFYTGATATTTNGTERMRISATGLVGIGETNPGAKLQVNTVAATTIGQIIKGAASQSVPIFEAQKSDATPYFSIECDGTVCAPVLKDGGSKPTCNSAHRGWMWLDAGGAGVKDAVEICAKDATDTYAWRVLY